MLSQNIANWFQYRFGLGDDGHQLDGEQGGLGGDLRGATELVRVVGQRVWPLKRHVVENLKNCGPEIMQGCLIDNVKILQQPK